MSPEERKIILDRLLKLYERFDGPLDARARDPEAYEQIIEMERRLDA